MPETIEATFEIVTPMFLGGASSIELADAIRPPSVKGALRFWWRALQWNNYYQKTNQDEALALTRLHAHEARLFGHAANDRNLSQGQACFLLRTHIIEPPKAAALENPGPGQQYLLGQGLYRNGYLRQAIPGGRFAINLRFKRALSSEDRETIARALICWGLLGGLGSRARRGLGSVAIQKIDGVDTKIPTNSDGLRAFIGALDTPEPPYSAFSSESRIEVINTGNQSGWNVLGQVGLELLKYRSYGVANARTGLHETAGIRAEQNFPNDHDWVLDAVDGNCPLQIPERGVFGFPHNYFFKSKVDQLKVKGFDNGPAAKRAKAEIAPVTSDRTRRASPLLIHLHKFPDGQTAAIQSLLPARFLPPGDPINIKTHQLNNQNCNLPFTPNYQVIHDYLDRFNGERVL